MSFNLRPPSGHNRGAVLIVVLWVLMGMSVLALSFGASVRTEVNATRNVVDQKQAYYSARAGIEYAVYRLMEVQLVYMEAQRAQDRARQQQAVTPLSTLSLPLTNSSVEIVVSDETGKLNLNLVPSHLLFNLLINVGIEGSQAEIITDSVEDWRDEDELYRANGAESGYYQTLATPYMAKNGPFSIPEELLLVRGVTPEIYYGKKGLGSAGEKIDYYGLQKYFTTFTGSAHINVNAAPRAVLAAIPGLDDEVAAEIERMRQTEVFIDPAQIMQKIPGINTEVLGYLSALRSNVYTLVASGKINGSEAVSRIRAVVQVGFGAQGYVVLYWNEANMEL
ncbi:MAG: general secretion pathway protein GspK [Acidobacteria bacterium]|nr:general secretion pathway protein GspK [Acidobacteriota bacterium]